jgi:hypothetical protein
MPGRTLIPPSRATTSSTKSFERPYIERQPGYALTDDTKISFFTPA